MLSDDILNHPIFDRKFETEEDFNSIEKTLAEAGIFMPEKYTWEPVKTVSKIFYDVDKNHFWTSEPPLISSDIEELYSKIHKAGMDASFDDSCLEADGLKRGIFGGIDVKCFGSWRMLFDAYDPRPLEFHNYFGFLKTAKAWREDPDNFVNAYYFTTNHPAFWYRPQHEKYPDTWVTNDGHHGLSLYVSNDGIGIEHGQSVPPTHSHHYHDHYMDVFEPTFELAHIAFAKNVHLHFHLDGTEREDRKGLYKSQKA